jgi:7-keto-8-aminopelargonate synthetase-like enzyme
LVLVALPEGTWSFNRIAECRDIGRFRLANLDGSISEGINFAAQDYLGLNEHPAVHEAVLRALREFGPAVPTCFSVIRGFP